MQIQPPADALFLKYTSHGIGLSKRLIFRRPAPFSPFLTPPASAQRIKQSKALASRQAAGAINVEPNYKDNKLTTNDETYTI
ncbi:MAG: hypothetical protein IJY72_02620, partial [Akkermansia sp.]|nr:hypothetical protein [Akkermansia sp.]